MKRFILLCGMAIAAISFATDHNNIDSGRPLRFDDAYSIAFRERALEFGVGIDTFRRRRPHLDFKAEYKYGFAKNQDLTIGFDPGYDSEDRRFDAGDIELGYFHGVRREIGNAPALAYRLDVGLPTGRDSRGVDVRLRAIATKAWHQYDKLHLNIDVGLTSGGPDGERDVTLGATLGYSSPFGYPRRFDQTWLAEFALQQSQVRGQGYTGTLGVGIRKQVDVRSVFDVGVESDIFSTRGAERTSLRVTVGYSVGF